LVLASRWEGTSIQQGVQHLPVAIAYVTDASLLNDFSLEFQKCVYVAIGLADDTSEGTSPQPLTDVMMGRIGRFFGVGNQ
jgi:hypothetical protein